MLAAIEETAELSISLLSVLPANPATENVVIKELNKQATPPGLLAIIYSLPV